MHLDTVKLQSILNFMLRADLSVQKGKSYHHGDLRRARQRRVSLLTQTQPGFFIARSSTLRRVSHNARTHFEATRAPRAVAAKVTILLPLLTALRGNKTG